MVLKVVILSFLKLPFKADLFNVFPFRRKYWEACVTGWLCFQAVCLSFFSVLQILSPTFTAVSQVINQ